MHFNGHSESAALNGGNFSERRISELRTPLRYVE